MSDFRIERSEKLNSEEHAFWTAALSDRDFGALTLPWTEAVRTAGPKNLELYYLQVYSGQERRALVVLHVLRSLDLSGYIGRTVKKIFSWIAKLGWRPLAVDLAFLEIPIANLGGIQFAPGAESSSQAIASAALAHIRNEIPYSVLCLKATPTQPGEAAFAQLGMLKTDFLANMGVQFKGEKSFEEFLKRINPKIRTQCRAYSREFVNAGGTIEIIEAPDQAVLEIMNRLYSGTLQYHAENSNLELPIPLSPEFFPSLVKALPGASRVFLARLNGDPVGFSLVLDSGGASYFTHCGLDYARTVPSRAYFNLYYAMIADSIRRGVRNLELGAEAYQVKKKLGAVACPTVYHFEVKNRVLRAIASFVARNFAAQEGAQLK